jgi:hypothetical protein
LEKPKIEPKPKSALAAALNANTEVPPPKTSSIKLEPPRPPSRVTAEKPAAAPAPRVMGKVVVKNSGAHNNKKTAMLVGVLAFLLVLAILWSGGYLSGSGSTPPKPPSPPSQQATLVPVKINWQRPSAPPLSRNPMRAGGGNSSGTNQRTGQDGTSSSFNVKGIFWSNDKGIAMIDDRYVRAGETYLGAKITSITKDYVEYQLEGVTKKVYVRELKSNQTGSTNVVPDANSQNIK